MKKKCVGCSGDVYFLATWKIVPEYCGFCRLLRVDGLDVLLEKFLKGEERLRSLRLSSDERVSFEAREALRLKVKEALEAGANQYRLAKVVFADRELRRLVSRLERERRISENYRPRRKKPMPAKIGSIVQGGAPGLGRRS